MKLYISGPMAGIDEFNYPAFHDAAELLRNRGFDVVNPAELNSIGDPYDQCIRNDIRALCDCDAIVLLNGWENSNGAHLELHIAHRMGLKMYFYDDLFLHGMSDV